MDWSQPLMIIISILVPMIAGFGWIIHQIREIDKRLSGVETRLTVVETILSMMRKPMREM